MRLGDIEIVPVPDGTAKLPPAYFRNADWGPHQALIGPDGNVDIPLGCFLIRGTGPTVLIDAGIGPHSSPIFQGGDLPSRLAAEGVSPSDIDLLICSHLHIDHSGWLVRGEKPFFPNATVRFGAADWGHFVTNANPDDGTRKALEVLEKADRVDTIDHDGEVTAGVSVVHAPGHTPGHSVVIVSSGDRRAILLGDSVTCPVQLEEPDWEAMSDTDPALARRTRDALWRELEGTRDVAVAAHFPGLEFGRVLTGEGRRYWA